MHLTVNHVTHFKFGEPATHSIQYIRMTPRADLCQRVRSWDITASGRLTPWSDGFDNQAHLPPLWLGIACVLVLTGAALVWLSNRRRNGDNDSISGDTITK